MGLSDAIGIGGSLLGGLFGGSKKQSSTSSIDKTTTGQSSGASSQQGWQQQIEEPWFGAARQGIMGQLMQQMKKANQPVFGPAQQAQYMQQLNGLAASSIDSLKANLARMGALDSGRLGAGLTDIGLGRMGKAADFFAQLPFQERQAQAAFMNPLLQIGAGWTGATPRSVFSSGSGTQESSSTTHETGTEKSSGSSSTPMWQGALGGLGAGLGASAGGMFGNMWGWGNGGAKGYDPMWGGG